MSSDPLNPTDSENTVETMLSSDVRSILDSLEHEEPTPFTEEIETIKADVPNICIRTMDGIDVTFESQSVITIGRNDEQRSIRPTFDLKNHSGYSYGVSRKHAKLTFNDGKFYITDLGSRNGTFLNGELIMPHQMTAINEGDKVKFGNFETLIVSIS